MIRPNSQYLSNPHPHKLIAGMHNESVHDTNQRGCSNGHAGLVSMCWIYAKRKEQKFTLIRGADGNEIDFRRLSLALTSAAWKLDAEAAPLRDVMGYCSTREPCAQKLALKHQGVPH